MSTKKQPGVSRRSLLAATAAATLSFPAILRGKNLNNKLNLVIIGCGGRGAANRKEVAGENIVAICDVNDGWLDAAAHDHPNARKFKDFRKLYDELKDSEFDGVVVSIPEHVHAFATMPALKRKKHVYCEKPLTRDVHEARLITQASIEAGVVTQMGTQIHSGDNYRAVVKQIQSGAIGPVTEVFVWVSRAWGRQSEADAKRNHDPVWSWERPTKADPIPKVLDWDLWIGPAPYRPFNNIYWPGPRWYRWWDFGNGTMSDLGSHWIDLPFWALNLDAPLSIESIGPPPHPEIAPASMKAKYEYAARGDLPAITVTWHQGDEKPELWKEKKIPQWSDGALFIGSKGMLLSDYFDHVLLPDGEKKTLKTLHSHQGEWIAACKGNGTTSCPFKYSGRLTEANHLGNVAYRAGKRIEWDTVNMKIPNAPEAEKFLRRDYRKGWSLP